MNRGVGLNRLSGLLGLLTSSLVWGVAPAQTVTGYGNTVFAFYVWSSNGAVVQGSDGRLFGTTQALSVSSDIAGTIFRTTLDGSSVETIYQLVGANGTFPSPLTLASDGNFYGATTYAAAVGNNFASGTGTVFRISQTGTNFTTLHTFAAATEVLTADGTRVRNPGGAFPVSQLVQGADGNLYGATSSGGANGTGAIFRLALDGTGFTALHEFGVIDTDGKSADGAFPAGPLLYGSDGFIYGTAGDGGTNSMGTVFKVASDGTSFQVLHDFSALTDSKNADGASPAPGLVEVNGLLYGTASAGGANSYGTIYSLTMDGSTFTTLRSFNNTDGASPASGMILGSDGKLYGTTAAGGSLSGSSTANAAGIVYAVNPDGSGFETVYAFDGSDGAYPRARLMQASDGNFYGTSPSLGGCGYGTVYRVSRTSAGPDGYVTRDCTNYDDGGGSMPLLSLLLLGSLGLWRRFGARIA